MIRKERKREKGGGEYWSRKRDCLSKKGQLSSAVFNGGALRVSWSPAPPCRGY